MNKQSVIFLIILFSMKSIAIGQMLGPGEVKSFVKSADAIFGKEFVVEYKVEQMDTAEKLKSWQQQIEEYTKRKDKLDVADKDLESLHSYIQSLSKYNSEGQRKAVVTAKYTTKDRIKKYTESSTIDFANSTSLHRSLVSYDNSRIMVTVDNDIKQALIRPSGTPLSTNLQLLEGILSEMEGMPAEDFIQQFDSFVVSHQGENLLLNGERQTSVPAHSKLKLSIAIDEATSRMVSVVYDIIDTESASVNHVFSKFYTYSSDAALYFMPSNLIMTKYGLQFLDGRMQSIPLQVTTLSVISSSQQTGDKDLAVPAVSEGASVIDTLTNETYRAGDAFNLVDKIIDSDTR